MKTRFSISHPVRLAVVLVTAALLSSESTENRALGQEGLFSEITMSQVLPAGDNDDKKSDSSIVLGVRGLTSLLTEASLKTETRGQSVYLAAGQLGPELQSTIGLSVDPERGFIQSRLILSQDASSVTQQQLITMLTRVSKESDVRLAMTGKQLELRSVVSNQNTVGKELREHLQSLAKLRNELSLSVKTTRPAQPAAPATKPAKAAPTKVVATQTPAPAPINLTGTWSARVSDSDAWAIRMQDKQFTMVHTKNNRNTISKGTFRIEGGRLVLAETGGVTLAGKLQASANAFQWSIQGKDGKTVMTLKFAKK